MYSAVIPLCHHLVDPSPPILIRLNSLIVSATGPVWGHSLFGFYLLWPDMILLLLGEEWL